MFTGKVRGRECLLLMVQILMAVELMNLGEAVVSCIGNDVINMLTNNRRSTRVKKPTEKMKSSKKNVQVKKTKASKSGRK
jgi:uncharacterized membrane protein